MELERLQKQLKYIENSLLYSQKSIQKLDNDIKKKDSRIEDLEKVLIKYPSAQWIRQVIKVKSTEKPNFYRIQNSGYIYQYVYERTLKCLIGIKSDDLVPVYISDIDCAHITPKNDYSRN
jgi:hypothetical protein